MNKLLGGAVDGLVRHGVEEENITAAWVPGAFEIPLTAQKMAQSGKYDAVICVGAVIRGDTNFHSLWCYYFSFNYPDKVYGLQDFGLEIKERVPLEIQPQK